MSVASAGRPMRERERRKTARRRSKATPHKPFVEHSARSESISARSRRLLGQTPGRRHDEEERCQQIDDKCRVDAEPGRDDTDRIRKHPDEGLPNDVWNLSVPKLGLGQVPPECAAAICWAAVASLCFSSCHEKLVKGSQGQCILGAVCGATCRIGVVPLQEVGRHRVKVTNVVVFRGCWDTE